MELILGILLGHWLTKQEEWVQYLVIAGTIIFVIVTLVYIAGLDSGVGEVECVKG